MKVIRIEAGRYKVENTPLEMLKFKKWNGYAKRTHWKLVTPATKTDAEKIHYVGRLVSDVKLHLFQNWSGSMSDAVVKQKLMRRKRAIKKSQR